MAAYTVPAGHLGVHEKTLVANTVDTVTFSLGSTDTPGWGRMPKRVEVLTDGDADIYLTLDGTAPTVGGTNCWRVPAAAGASTFEVDAADPAAVVVVKLISDGTPTYSVGRG